MRSVVANTLVVAGGVSVTAGCYLLATWLALVIGGVIAGCFGVLLAMASSKEGES